MCKRGLQQIHLHVTKDAAATIDDGSCEYITPVDLGENIETCEESVTLDAGSDMIRTHGVLAKQLKLLK